MIEEILKSYGWTLPFAAILLFDKYLGLYEKKIIYGKLLAAWVWVSDLNIPNFHKKTALSVLSIHEKLFGNFIWSFRFFLFSGFVSSIGVLLVWFFLVSAGNTGAEIDVFSFRHYPIYGVFLGNIVFDWLTLLFTLFILKKIVGSGIFRSISLLALDLFIAVIMLLSCFAYLNWQERNIDYFPFYRELVGIPLKENVVRNDVVKVMPDVSSSSDKFNWLLLDEDFASLKTADQEEIRGDFSFFSEFPFGKKNFVSELRTSLKEMALTDFGNDYFDYFPEDSIDSDLSLELVFSSAVVETIEEDDFMSLFFSKDEHLVRENIGFEIVEIEDRVDDKFHTVNRYLEANEISLEEIDKINYLSDVGCVSYVWCFVYSPQKYILALSDFGILLSRSNEFGKAHENPDGTVYFSTNRKLFSASKKLGTLVNRLPGYRYVLVEKTNNEGELSEMHSFLMPVDLKKNTGKNRDKTYIGDIIYALFSSTVIIPSLFFILTMLFLAIAKMVLIVVQFVASFHLHRLVQDDPNVNEKSFQPITNTLFLLAIISSLLSFIIP